MFFSRSSLIFWENSMESTWPCRLSECGRKFFYRELEASLWKMKPFVLAALPGVGAALPNWWPAVLEICDSYEI